MSIRMPGRRVKKGIVDADIRQVVLLAITTLGFPAAMAAYSWVNDMLEA